MTTALIAYAIVSFFFTGFILALINGGKRNWDDDDAAAIEGAFPADRFEESN